MLNSSWFLFPLALDNNHPTLQSMILINLDTSYKLIM